MQQISPGKVVPQSDKNKKAARRMVLGQALESLQFFRGRECYVCVQRDKCHDQTGKHTVICIVVCVC